jgi:hypothetical protein
MEDTYPGRSFVHQLGADQLIKMRDDRLLQPHDFCFAFPRVPQNRSKLLVIVSSSNTLGQSVGASLYAQVLKTAAALTISAAMVGTLNHSSTPCYV